MPAYGKPAVVAGVVVGGGLLGGLLAWILTSPPTRSGAPAPPAGPPPPPDLALEKVPELVLKPPPSSSSFAGDTSPAWTGLWVNSKTVDGWYGWTFVGKFNPTLETNPGDFFAHQVSARDQIAAWLTDHAQTGLRGAWATARWDGTQYTEHRAGLFGHDIQNPSETATFAANGSLTPGYV